MEAADSQHPPSPETGTSHTRGEPEEEEVMSEVHLGCPPNFSGPFISEFTFSIPPEVEFLGSRYECLIQCQRDSLQHELSLDEDGDLLLTRRSKKSRNKFDMTIQHNITSSIPMVGLQVWRAELVLSDFVLHKMLTTTEFEGIVAVELGAGTGLVGMLLALAAKTVFLTDHGTEVLENCAKNLDLNDAKFPHKASVLVRELDWKASWPPRLQKASSCERYGWSLSEVDELQNASLLVAADVIYSDDLTDALFSTLERLMSLDSDKVFYMALEKRYNFSLDEFNVVANGYSRFRRYVRDEGECRQLQNEASPCFAGKLIDLTEIPQYVRNYERGHDVELWQIKYEKNTV